MRLFMAVLIASALVIIFLTYSSIERWAVQTELLKSLVPNVHEAIEFDVIRRDAPSALSLFMRDPGSAQFRNLVVRPLSDKKTIMVCGWVNGKNNFGAYTGYKRFAAYFTEKKQYTGLDIDDENPKASHDFSNCAGLEAGAYLACYNDEMARPARILPENDFARRYVGCDPFPDLVGNSKF